MWLMQQRAGQARQRRRAARPTTCTSSAWSALGLHVGADGQGGAGRSSTAGAGEREAFLRNKLIAGRYFMERIMPETALRTGPDRERRRTMMAMAAAAF